MTESDQKAYNVADAVMPSSLQGLDANTIRNCAMVKSLRDNFEFDGKPEHAMYESAQKATGATWNSVVSALTKVNKVQMLDTSDADSDAPSDWLSDFTDVEKLTLAFIHLVGDQETADHDKLTVAFLMIADALDYIGVLERAVHDLACAAE